MDSYLPRPKLLLVFLITMMNGMIHFTQFPSTIIGFMILVWFYRFMCLWRGWALPPKVICVTLAFGGWVICFSAFGLQMSEELSTALLATALSVKLLETANYRHALVSLIVCYYLLVAKLLSDISLWTSVFLFFDVIVITVVMFMLSYRSSAPVRVGKIFIPVLKMSLQATPILVLLFFIFPRFSTSMFGLRNKEKAVSGMSENLDPGGISQLVYSDEPVFRAKINNGKKLQTSKLYWKAGVLFESNGMSWSPPRFYQRVQDVQIGNPAESISQEILLEPGQGKFLFGLDTMSSLDSKNNKFLSQFYPTIGQTFRLKQSLNTEIKYNVLSQDKVLYSKMSPQVFSLYTLVSGEQDLPLIHWVNENLGSLKTMEEKVNKVFELFAEGGFFYSLTPKKLESNTVSEFLFQTKEGFCEHYASALATIMRLSGYPSRVVIGYLGGEYNGRSGYYLVSNKDAHAWTEVWNIHKSTWERFDPVTVVAPQRLTLGARQFYESMIGRLGAGELAQVETDSLLNLAWAETRLFIDDLNFRWTMFMMTYDQQTQYDFLQSFGLTKNWRLKLFILSVVFIVGFYFVFTYFKSKTPRNPVSEAMRGFSDKVKKYGVEREGHESPQQFLSRCSELWPEMTTAIHSFSEQYVLLRYGKVQISNADLHSLKAILKEMKFKKLN